MQAINFETSSTVVPSQSFKMGSYAAPSIEAPFTEAAFRDATAVSQYDLLEAASADWGNLVRGIRWAFAIEAGAVLMVYTIWRLWF